MPEYDDMLRSLPSAYRRDPWVTGLLGAVAGVDSAQRADAAETADQMFLDSMTWLLPVEEREAGLTPEKGASIEDRRAALAAKWRSLSGKCDIELIRTICGSWNGIAAEVTYDGGIVRYDPVPLHGRHARQHGECAARAARGHPRTPAV